MTTENTNQPHVSDQAVEGVNAADNQAAQDQVKDIGSLSVEELENLPPEKLHEFLSMAENIGGEEGNAPAATPEPTPAPTPAPTDAPASAEGDKAPAMIPKPRFDEVLTHNKDLEAENVKLKEQLAFAAGVASGNPAVAGNRGPDPMAEVANQMNDLDKNFNKQMDELVDKFDNGDLTMKQFRQEEQKLRVATQAIFDGLDDKKRHIEQERTRPNPQTVNDQIIKDPRLEAATAKLKLDNPWLESVTDAQMTAMTALAYSKAQEAGHKITPDVSGTWLLRQYIVLAGRDLNLDKLIAGGSGQPAANAGNGSQPPAAGAPTAQQRQDKIKLAGQQPPLPTVAGVNAPTDALGTHNVDKMTDVELADALPTSALEKLAGITS